MLSTDDPIDLLIEKLDALARPDRSAILKRLTPAQRAQIARLRVKHLTYASERHTPDLIERFSGLDGDNSPLTPSAREALRRAMKPTPPVRAPRGTSLADAAASLFRKQRSA